MPALLHLAFSALDTARALEDVISPENRQGINNRTVTPAERDAVWKEVVRQVVEQGCRLGYRAAALPLIQTWNAEPAALEAPAPLC